MSPLRKAALGLVLVWFFFGGIGHFVWTDALVSVVPAYVPAPLLIVLTTGVFEIAAALALLSPRLRPLAGLALMLFTICVTPLHIDMLIHADRHPNIGAPLLWLRLLFQPVLVWIIWQATRRRNDSIRAASINPQGYHDRR